MSLERGIGDTGPVRPDATGMQEERRAARSTRMAAGTLACPACDAPVAPGPQPLRPSAGLACPVCDHAGAVRDFLSLAPPTRPARVEVHVVSRPLRTRSRF